MLINGQPGDSVPASDRGLAYGDGVFRTVELVGGVPRLWRWQWRRLQSDCAALRLPCPDEAQLLAELATAAAGLPRAVGKIVLTRGSGQRGYAIPGDARPTRLVSAAPWGGYPAERLAQGATLRVCDTRLGVQPRLAGVKHLNRLENVLARSEWSDPAVHEGLMLDVDGWVVEATMSNVYALRGELLYTPLLDRSGVRGAVRDWVQAHAGELGVSVVEARLTLDELLSADALMLSNSLMPIWPVARLAGREWTGFALAQALHRRLLQET